MNRLTLIPLLFTIALLLLLSTGPLLLKAEERSNTTITNETEVQTQANYNNTRSNRSSITTPDATNVCDGVTCPDGKCAATADECTAATTDASSSTSTRYIGNMIMAPDMASGSSGNSDTDADNRLDVRDLDSDGDGIPDTVESSRLNHLDPDDDNDSLPTREGTHNSDRSNEIQGRFTPVAGDDCDDDDTCIHPSGRTQTNDEDEVSNEDDIIAPAQDYNSTRSNRRKNVFGGGSDLDGDGWPEVTLRAGAFIRLGSIEGEATARGDLDSSVVCWGRAEDEGGRVYSWGRGLCVAPDTRTDADGTTRDRIAALQVHGDNVRAWSEAERSAWREYRANRPDNVPEERLIESVIETAQRDERIKEILIDDEGVDLTYRAEMRFLGVVPIHRDIATRISGAGDIEIDYPWYSFLTTKPQDKTIRSILLDTIDLLKLTPIS